MHGKANASELRSDCDIPLEEAVLLQFHAECSNEKPHLSSIFPPEMTQDGLRPMCPFLPQIHHSQSLASVVPLIPLILPVDVLVHRVHLSLTLPVTCDSLQAR